MEPYMHGQAPHVVRQVRFPAAVLHAPQVLAHTPDELINHFI